MILALFAAVFAAPFAPPAGAIRYTIRALYSERPRQSVTTVDRLAFTRERGFTVAHLTTLSRTVDAPPAAKEALERLFGPLTGIESQLALDPMGRPGALIDSERPWAAFLASRAALRAKIDADPKLPLATKAAAHRVLDAETAPAARDERLREPFLRLLPPPLPPLAVGASENFSATIATPTGPLPASGTVTLVAAEERLIRYQVTMTTEPIAAAKVHYSETSALTIDRATGLLASARRIRSLVFADGHSQLITTEDITANF